MGLAAFVANHPRFVDFKAELTMRKKSDSGLSSQLLLFRQGYVELSPTFDPGQDGETSLKNFAFDGIPFSVSLKRVEDSRLEVRVKSARKIRMQVNQNWLGKGTQSCAVDETQSSSPIFEIGAEDSDSVSRFRQGMHLRFEALNPARSLTPFTNQW